ncbi:MAG: hypothetical protein ACI3YC_02805 [Alloprevotella sp.]
MKWWLCAVGHCTSYITVIASALNVAAVGNEMVAARLTSHSHQKDLNI